MADQEVTNMDSAAAATTPMEGTEAPASGLSRDGDPGTASPQAAAPADLQLDEELIKKYESTQAFQEKFVPKSVFTQKTQALAEDRKRFETEKAAILELARKAIAEKTLPAGPSAEEVKRKELQDLAAAGDSQALQQLIRMEAEALVQPVKTQVALQTAAQAARSANPYVVQHWNEIIQTMQQDPVIAKMATMDNYAAADRVMIALGLEHQVKDLSTKYEVAQKEVETLKAKLQTYERERAASLPSSTARAGTTSGRPAAGQARNIEDAALAAWKEMGLPESEFR